jgi:hypothetical protein
VERARLCRRDHVLGGPGPHQRPRQHHPRHPRLPRGEISDHLFEGSTLLRNHKIRAVRLMCIVFEGPGVRYRAIRNPNPFGATNTTEC